MIDVGDGVLPQLRLRGNQRAEIAGAGPHVAVRQLEPRLGEGVSELIRVLVEAPRYLLVGRVCPQREVGGQHGRRVTLETVVGIRNRASAGATLRSPLMRTGRALRQFPFVAEQVPEEVVAPSGRRGGPGDFQAAGDRIGAFAAAEAVLPAETLLLQGRSLWFRTEVPAPIGSTVGLAERVSAGNERNRLFVIPRHAAERFSNVLCCSERIGVAVRPLRINVDQAHMIGAERTLEFAAGAVV